MQKCLFILLCLISNIVSANSITECPSTPIDRNAKQTFAVSKIEVNTLPIFNEEDADSIALHRWANALHIITQPKVIKQRLPFQIGDSISMEDIIEAEAILRNERYLANAHISLYSVCESSKANKKPPNVGKDVLNPTLSKKVVPAQVIVTTYDNWSLQPTVSFSRSGGENRTILGVREDNLLGLGIRAQFRYNSNEQRTGYNFSFSSIAPFMRHATMYLNLSDNDDGERYQFIFNKPFYHLADKRMLYFEGLDESRVDEIFQNGSTRNSFEVENSRLILSSGWQVQSENEETHRIILGLAVINSKFDDSLSSVSITNDFLPQNREYQYPFITFSHVTRDIKVFQDVRLIQQPEDINLGLEYQFTLGLEVNDVKPSNDFGYHASGKVSKAWNWGEDLLFLRTSLNATIGTTAEDYLRLDTIGEYFTRQNSKIAYYARLATTFSKGQFLDQPIVIDDDSGVRGYTNQYQHGDHRISASAEARFYTDYSFYQLFNLGYAAYLDVGRAFNGVASNLNENDKTLASLGVGFRVYSNKSSTPGVVHLDFTKPLVSGENVDNFLFSVQLRRGF